MQEQRTTETPVGRMLRQYPELGEREVRALVIESERTTPEALARELAGQLEDAGSYVNPYERWATTPGGWDGFTDEVSE